MPNALVWVHVHPTVVSERLGHAPTGITLDIYSHVQPELDAQAATTVAQLFDPVPDSRTIASGGDRGEAFGAAWLRGSEPEFAEIWRATYPAMIRSWETSWAEFVPFLEFPAELRKIVYTTNAIESLNARFRRAVRHRGHFSNEQAALKVLYLVATQRRKNRETMTGRTNGWKQILNALTVHYGDRITNIDLGIVPHGDDR